MFLYNTSDRIISCVFCRIFYCIFKIEISIGIYTTLVYQARSVVLWVTKDQGLCVHGDSIKSRNNYFAVYVEDVLMCVLLCNLYLPHIFSNFIHFLIIVYSNSHLLILVFFMIFFAFGFLFISTNFFFFFVSFWFFFFFRYFKTFSFFSSFSFK